MRSAVWVAVAAWCAPVGAVGVHAFGAPLWLVLISGAALGCLAAWFTAPALADTLAPVLRRRIVASVLALLATAAIVQIAGVSVYVIDPSRPQFSYQYRDAFRVRHACLTAYYEALRFCAEPGTDIYTMALYEPRFIGPLRVDSFHYPPQFLLLPAGIKALRPAFFQFRELWFVMQSAILAGGVFGLARWIGGMPGAYAAAGAVLAFALPQFVYSLQQGNIQSSVIPGGAVALVLLCSGRYLTGAPVLAYLASAKIFPGILLAFLFGGRRWKAIAATAVSAFAIAIATLLIFGAAPFEDFIRHELPAISNGAAFPQSEGGNTMSANISLYGLTVRLRALGATWLTQPRGLAVASVYGLFVIAIALFAGWRMRVDLATPAGRLRLVQFGVALLMLASFRSPFVGFYGYLSAVWLMTLLLAGARSPRGAAVGACATAAFAIAHAVLPSPAGVPTRAALVVSSIVFCTALGAGIVAVLRAVRAADAVPPESSPRGDWSDVIVSARWQ